MTGQHNTNDAHECASRGLSPSGAHMGTVPLSPDRVVPTAKQLAHAEFDEMPGLSLTPRQAARLWGLTHVQSERLLTGLVEDGFLIRDRRGAYRRGGCPRCS